MNVQDIVRRRMHAQHLWGPGLADARSVVRHLAAMQAQELGLAKWSVGQRADGVGIDAVDAAYAAGDILRTHILRPTWHFVARDDLGWLMDLSAPRVHALNAYMYRQSGIDDELARTTNRLIDRAVAGGQHRTRKELAAVLRDAKVEAAGVRLGYIVMRAELDKVICSGAPRGKQQTYAAFDMRATGALRLTPEETLAELTRRYFTSRGPATLKDYLRWSSLTVMQGTRGLELVGSELGHDSVDGRTYWFSPSSAAPPKLPSSGRALTPRIDLVQCYDEYVMGYSESRDVLLQSADGEGGDVEQVPVARRIAFLHAILRDGRLIGRWRPAVKRRGAEIEVATDRPLDADDSQALDAAADRYGRFHSLPATVIRTDA